MRLEHSLHNGDQTCAVPSSLVQSGHTHNKILWYYNMCFASTVVVLQYFIVTSASVPPDLPYDLNPACLSGLSESGLGVWGKEHCMSSI